MYGFRNPRAPLSILKHAIKKTIQFSVFIDLIAYFTSVQLYMCIAHAQSKYIDIPCGTILKQTNQRGGWHTVGRFSAIATTKIQRHH